MGIKRLLTVTLVIVLVLGLVVLLLFQAGADQKLVESVLPRIEKRFGIRIHFEDIDTSLTSITLRNVKVRSRKSQCLFIQAERITVNMRVGPLFLGEVDLTGLRADGLEVRIGTQAAGCGVDEWMALANAISKKGASRATGAGKSRPEVHIASGKIAFGDPQLAFDILNFSGRIGDDAKTVVEIDGYELRVRSRRLLAGNGAEVRYSPDTGQLFVATKGPALDITASRQALLALFRDLRQSWHALREELKTLHKPRGPTTVKDGATVASFFPRGGIAVGITKASCLLTGEGSATGRAEDRPETAIRDISVDISLHPDRRFSLRSGGRLPGTDARFGLAVETTEEALPKLTLRIPDVSLSTLGPMLFPSPHIAWQQASLDGELQISAEKNLKNIKLSGQIAFSKLNIRYARLAAEPIEGLDLSSDFTLSYDREEQVLHLERFQLVRKLARMTARGEIHLDRLAFDLYFSIPPTNCQHIKDAIPETLMPKAKNTKFEGQLTFDTHLALDEENPEAVVFEPDLENRCRIAAPGDIPEPNYFRGPFAYVAYTETGEPLRLVSGLGTDRWTPLGQISSYLIDAVTVTEDGKFWNHKGITVPEIERAIELNLKNKTLNHGASTITMQLAKNLFLDRERTIARKLQELLFVWYLESYFTKEEILELYFNIVEFGPSIYGIGDAALHYFGREPNDLNALESVFLIKLLPSPVSRYKMYEKGSLSERQIAMLHRVLKVMRERHRITDQELDQALSQEIVFHKEGDPLPEPRSPDTRQPSRYSEISEETIDDSFEIKEDY